MIGRGISAMLGIVAGVLVVTSSCAAAGPAPTPSASASVSPSGSVPVSPSDAPGASTPPAVPDPPVFDRSRLSIDDPTSIWVVSDKLRPLAPVDYVPADLVDTPVSFQNPPALRAEAAAAMTAMFDAGRAEGAGGMTLQSAYRSYAVQVNVYGGYVSRLGQAAADLTSARPGHSEHQTGLAADISPLPLSCVLESCFGETPQGRWLAGESWRFGYVLRYPADKTSVTGFEYEPWHFRFVGVELAAEMHGTGVTTLEEFFGLPPAPGYTP